MKSFLLVMMLLGVNSALAAKCPDLAGNYVCGLEEDYIAITQKAEGKETLFIINGGNADTKSDNVTCSGNTLTIKEQLKEEIAEEEFLGIENAEVQLIKLENGIIKQIINANGLIHVSGEVLSRHKSEKEFLCVKEIL